MTIVDPIIIVGCPRSGTSLTAGIIDACGAFGGDHGSARKYNAKGYFENLRLRHICNEVFPKVELVAAMWALGRLSEAAASHARDAVRLGIEEVLIEQGYTGGPWYFKYPNALNDVYTTNWLFPAARWVVTRREEKDIRASAPRDLFKNFSSADEAVSFFLEKLPTVGEVAPDHIEVWPFERLAQGVDQFKPIIKQLGLTWNQEAVRAFADPALVHHDSQKLFEAAPH